MALEDAPDQGALAQPDQSGPQQPDAGPLSQVDPARKPDNSMYTTGFNTTPAPSTIDTNTGGTRFSKQATDNQDAPQHDDLAYLQDNAADPKVRQAFAKEFGGLPQGFKVPPPAPEDLQYLKDHANDKGVWDAFQNNFGPDSVPKDFQPSSGWGTGVTDYLKDYGSYLPRMADMARLFGQQGASSDQAADAGSSLEQKGQSDLEKAKAQYGNDTSITGPIKDAGKALFAALEVGAGATTNFLLKNREGDREGAPDQNLQQRFGDFVRANYRDQTDTVKNNADFIRSLPPEQAAAYMKELGGNMPPEQLASVVADLKEPIKPNIFDKVANAGDAGAKALLDSMSPAAKFRAQKDIINADGTLGPGAEDPETIGLHAAGMAGFLTTIVAPGMVAGKLAGVMTGVQKLNELRESGAPIAEAERLAGEASIVAKAQANGLTNRVIAGTSIGGGQEQQVRDQIKALPEETLMKLPEYKAMIDAKMPREFALEAVEQNPSVIAAMSGILIGGITGPGAAKAMDGFADSYAGVIARMEAATAAARKPTVMQNIGQAASNIATGAGTAGALGAGSKVSTNVAEQASGQDTPTLKGAGEAFAEGAIGGGIVGAASHGAGALAGLTKRPGTSVSTDATYTKTGSADEAGASGADKGPQPTAPTPPSPITALRALQEGSEVSPEDIQTLKDAGFIKTGKSTGNPMILPAGRRALAEAERSDDDQGGTKAPRTGNEPAPQPAKEPAQPPAFEEPDNAEKAPRTPDETQDLAGKEQGDEETKRQQMQQMQESRQAEIQSFLGSKREEDYSKALNQKGEQQVANEAYSPNAPENRAMVSMGDALRMAQQSSQQLRDTIPRAPSLSTNDRNVESNFIDKISSNLPAAIQEYKQLPSTDGGRIINVDEVRQLSDDFKQNPGVSQAVHEPSSWLANVMYKQELAQPPKPGQDNLVLMTAGGTGSGKSSALDLPGMGVMTQRAQIIFDTAMNSPETALDKVDAAVKAGKSVIIHYMYRNPVDAFVNGSLPRSMANGRAVPIEAHQQTHAGAPKAIKAIMKKYGDNPKVQVIASVVGSGRAAPIDPEEAVKLPSTVSRATLKAKALEALNNGTISPIIYARTTGEYPPGTDAGARSGSGSGDEAGSGEERGEDSGREIESERAAHRRKLDLIEKRARRRFTEERAKQVQRNIKFAVKQSPREALAAKLKAEKEKPGREIAEDLAKNNLSPTVMAAAEIGALKIVRGLSNIDKWNQAMAKDFGPAIKPELEKLYSISKDKTRDIKSLVYQKTKEGTYKGGPPGITKDDLATLRATLRKLAREGASEKDWYDKVSNAVIAATGGNKSEAKKFAGVLSIFSAANSVGGNTTMGLRAWYQYKAGKPISAGTTDLNEIAQRFLDFGVEPEGMKQSNFYGNIMQRLEGGDSTIYRSGVTVDRWMLRALGYYKDMPSDAEYAFVSDQVRKVAKDMGWTPEQAQAAIWVAIKARWEDVADEVRPMALKKGWIHVQTKANGDKKTIIDDPERYYSTMLKHSLEGAVDPASIKRAGASYASELQKHATQVSWEALPATETGQLAGLQHQPLEVQQEFQRDVANALINPETGNDHLREALGLLSYGHINGNSAWFNDSGQILRFRHWGPQGLQSVDPRFATGLLGGKAEKSRTNKTISLYPYELTSEQPEGIVKNGRTEYIAEIPASLLYNAARDPLGLREAATTPTAMDGEGNPTDFAYDHDDFEKLVKGGGYLGYYLSKSEDKLMQGQARLFKPWPVTPADKYVNFDGYAKAGAQELLYTPLEKGATRNSDAKLDPNARAILESYAAALGKVNYQNAVGWHRARYDTTLKSSNGMEVTMPNATVDDYLRAYKAVTDIAKWSDDIFMPANPKAMELAPIQTDSGFRFVNWGEFDNTNFRDIVSRAMQEAFPATKPEVTPFAADGGLIYNDWTKHKNGEQYDDIIERNGHASQLREPISAVTGRVAKVYSTYAKRLGLNAAQPSGEAGSASRITAPISLDQLKGKAEDLQRIVRVRFGRLTKDLKPAGKLYDLAPIIQDPTKANIFAKNLGFDVDVFSFTSDPDKGIEFKLPQLGKRGYEGGKLWIYDPRVGAASFHDADYTRAWRITHELGHALTEPFMQAKYGDSRRYGRLGQESLQQRGSLEKGKPVPVKPLTLAEAQRAVEWEDAAFRMQRAILQKMGVSINDADFAREYNTNLSDAVYRVLTGDFTDLDGLEPSATLPDLRATLQLLKNSEITLAKDQGREPTSGANLDSWAPVSDADLTRALEDRMSVKTTPAREGEDYKVTAHTSEGDEVEGDHDQLLFDNHDDAQDYADTHPLPAGADSYRVEPVSRNPFKGQIAKRTGSPNFDMVREFQNAYPEVGNDINERLVNGNTLVQLNASNIGGEIYLGSIRSLEPGTGAGTKALADIVALADKHQVRLELNAVPLDKSGIQAKQLQDWYAKLGFKLIPDNFDLMVREPQDKPQQITPFATNAGKGISDKEASEVVRMAQSMFPQAQHHLVKSIEETPPEVQAEAQMRGVSDKVMAVYVSMPDGTHIYMIQNNMDSPEEALDTLVQENVGHDGIAKTFGTDVSNLMDGFLRNGSLMPSILRMAAREGLNLAAAKNQTDRTEVLRAATEEWLAHGAGLEMRNGNTPKGLKTAVGGVMSKMKVWAAAKGLPIKLDRDDALTALRRAHDYVKSGRWTSNISKARDAKEAEKVKFAVKPQDEESIKRQNAKMGEQPKGPNTEGYLTRAGRVLNDLRAKTLIESADQLYRIKQYEEDAQIPPAESGYISARLSTNVMPQIRTLLEWGGIKWTPTPGFDPEKSAAPDYDPTVKPLNQIHAPLGNDPQMLRNFEWYQYGLRARELMAQGREHSMTQEDIDDALSYAVKYPHFVQMQKDVTKLNKNVLDFAQQAGIINPESRKLWESEYYVPLYRVSEDAKQGPFASGSLGHVRNQIHRLKGGTANVKDITGNMVQNWKALVSAATKAHAARVAIDNITPYGLAKRMPDVLEAVMSADGIYKVLDQHGIGAVTESSMAGIRHLLSMHQAPQDADTVTIWRNGKREYWQMYDPMLAQSFAALKNSPLASLSQVYGLKSVMGLFGGAKRGLTDSIVHTPVFWLRTLYKDNINAWVVSRGIMPVKPIVSAITGTLKTIREVPNFRRMSAAGATFNQGRNDPSDLHVGRKKYLTRPSWLGRQWQNYLSLTSSSENASRITVYEKTLGTTNSHKLAAFEARDIMDYAMRGASPLVHAIVETVPFWGAHSQGMYKTGRSVVSDSGAYGAPTIAKKIVGRTLLHSLDTMYAAALVKGGMMAFLAAATVFHNFNNQAYQDLPDLQRETSFNVYVGDHRFHVPKQFESGLVYGTVPEAMTTAALSDNKPTVAKEQALFVYHAFMNALDLNPTPQLVKPLIELYGNSDWANNGNPILSSFDQELAPGEQVGPRTSPTITAVARHMPFGHWLQSPKQLEFLVNGYAGMLGSYVLQATDAGMRAAHMAPESPDNTWSQIPVISSFIPNEGEPGTTKPLQELNRVMKAAAPVEASVRELENEYTEESVQRAVDLMKSDPEEWVAAHAMSGTAKQIHEWQNMQRKIRSAPDMSAEEKKKLIDTLQQGINSSARKVYEYRPGGKINKDIAKGLTDAATPADKADVLRKNGMPQTASLVMQLGKRMPPSVAAAIEELG